MIPAVTAVRMTGARNRAELPLLVLGPSLGTSASALWGDCASLLTDVVDVLGWDLPGHGHNRAVPEERFSMSELAAGVLRVVDDVLAERGEVGEPFFYAGDSVGGAVGLQLLLDAPDRVASAVLLCTGAQIGEPALWAGRMGQVSASGTAVMVSGSAERWFGPGFLEREPARGAALLHALQETDDDGYVQVCAALSEFDVRDRLAEIHAPVLAVAGAADVATPPDRLREVAEGVPDGRLVVLDGVAHLAPAEAAHDVARLLREHLLGEVADHAAHPAATATTDLTRDVQDLLSRQASGSVWSRPGLDRRSRSLVVLTALVARGDHEELPGHLRVARDNGLTLDEIKELMVQAAIHSGVPEANAAFRIAQQVLGEG